MMTFASWMRILEFILGMRNELQCLQNFLFNSFGRRVRDFIASLRAFFTSRFAFDLSFLNTNCACAKRFSTSFIDDDCDFLYFISILLSSQPLNMCLLSLKLLDVEWWFESKKRWCVHGNLALAFCILRHSLFTSI